MAFSSPPIGSGQRWPMAWPMASLVACSFSIWPMAFYMARGLLYGPWPSIPSLYMANGLLLNCHMAHGLYTFFISGPFLAHGLLYMAHCLYILFSGPFLAHGLLLNCHMAHGLYTVFLSRPFLAHGLLYLLFYTFQWPMAYGTFYNSWLNHARIRKNELDCYHNFKQCGPQQVTTLHTNTLVNFAKLERFTVPKSSQK